jgi:hypothetical protein
MQITLIGAPQLAAAETPPATPNEADLVRVAELRALVAALAALVAAHGQEHCLQANPGDRAAPNRLAFRACPV